jgi:hypothetical protein
LSEYTTRSRVTQHPAVYDDVVVLPPSATIEAANQPASVETNLGFVLTIANLALTGIIVIAMMIDGTQAKNAIVVGSLYFAITTGTFALVVTGTLTNIVNGWQRERTERLKVQAYRELGELNYGWKIAIEETRQLELAGRRPPTGGAQRISPLNSYVPAIEDGQEAQSEAVRFAMGLYATNGKPDPKKLHPDGRLAGRMLGSKRGAGSRDAGRWLLREGIIKRVRGGYALNIALFPNRDSLRHLL